MVMESDIETRRQLERTCRLRHRLDPSHHADDAPPARQAQGRADKLPAVPGELVPEKE